MFIAGANVWICVCLLQSFLDTILCRVSFELVTQTGRNGTPIFTARTQAKNKCIKNKTKTMHNL